MLGSAFGFTSNAETVEAIDPGAAANAAAEAEAELMVQARPASTVRNRSPRRTCRCQWTGMRCSDGTALARSGWWRSSGPRPDDLGDRAGKARKSLLMLYLASCLAVGRCPWTERPTDPVVVAYLDLEMTEDDLLERVEDMGLAPDQLGNLRYFLRPDLHRLDTPEGGKALLALLDEPARRAGH